MMKRLGGLLGVIFLALILAGCVVTEEKHVEKIKRGQVFTFA